MSSALTYRPEIDGLRAIAVLSVLFFHAGLSTVPGGFLGVDIFFVLSGYLITGNMMREMQQELFSFSRFYERRIRRIIPVLMVVMFCSFPLAMFMLQPEEMKLHAQAIIATLLFASNFFFYLETGYFQASADNMFLIHTWSLAIEEQFYLMFPLLLFGLYRLPRLLLPVIVVIGGFSIVLAQIGSSSSPSFNFYFTFSRVFEFVIGGIIAARPISISRLPSWTKHCLEIIGLALILGSIHYFDETFETPNAWLLIPLMGCAMILTFGTRDGVIGSVLSSFPFRSIGLISYSLYLWHQPIFATVRMLQKGELTLAGVTISIIITMGFSIITYFFVEKPFRNRNRVSPRVLFVSLGGMLLGLCLVSVAVWQTDGFRNRYLAKLSPIQKIAFEGIEADAAVHGVSLDNGDCRFHAKGVAALPMQRLLNCRAKYGQGLLIIGDSHSIGLYNVFHNAVGNPFVLGLSRGGFRPTNPRNRKEWDLLSRMILDKDFFANVIYHQAGFYMVHDDEGRDGDRSLFLKNRESILSPDMKKIAATSHYLSGISKHVCVLWLGPKIDPFLPIRRLHLKAGHSDFSIKPDNKQAYIGLDAALTQHNSTMPFEYLSLIKILKFDQTTEIMRDGVAFFRDTDHWSTAGEALFGPRILRELEKSETIGALSRCKSFFNRRNRL
jgi:peptidoglycan/LPS O-acetylase OafA/YrhL